MQKKEIVIIGAGYGGLRAAELLSRKSGFHITLIDRNPYHYMQTEVYGYIAGRFDMSDIAIDLERFTQGLGENVTFLQREVTGIAYDPQRVMTSEGSYPFDYAIIAVGTQTNFFTFIEGLREHTHGVKSIERAFLFRQAFEKRLADKLRNRTFKRAGDLHIAIAGAGLSGVEIAAEMAYTLRRYEKILARCSKRLHISLIDAAPTILPGMHPYLIEKATKRLESLGVAIHTDAFISRIETRDIIFRDGKRMEFDFMIFTAGIKAADLTQKLGAPTNGIGQILPTQYLRLPECENIFAIGDCAQIRDRSGAIMPPTAQTAEKSAAYVADAIRKLERGEALEPFREKVDGVFIALGGEYALGMLFDRIRIEGYLAYLLKKAITRLYRLGLELKVNAGYRKRNLPRSA